MTFLHTLFLGALSGLTIFFGLPLARFRAVSKVHISFLNAFAVGVLFFLFTDITQHAVAPVESAIQNHAEYVTLLPVLIGGFMVGLLSLIYYTRWFRVKKGELSHAQLALVIAIGIGLHNFSEGLAIGNSASQNVLNSHSSSSSVSACTTLPKHSPLQRHLQGKKYRGVSWLCAASSEDSRIPSAQSSAIVTARTHSPFYSSHWQQAPSCT